VGQADDAGTIPDLAGPLALVIVRAVNILQIAGPDKPERDRHLPYWSRISPNAIGSGASRMMPRYLKGVDTVGPDGWHSWVQPSPRSKVQSCSAGRDSPTRLLDWATSGESSHRQRPVSRVSSARVTLCKWVRSHPVIVKFDVKPGSEDAVAAGRSAVWGGGAPCAVSLLVVAARPSRS
jgi:hypothetical protein